MQDGRRIHLPLFCLVLLVGASGSGKSHFARRHFSPTQIVSSDAIRAMLTDDESSQDVNPETFELLHQIVRVRLAHGRMTVVDATNVQADKRVPVLEIARAARAPVVAIVFDYPEPTTQARNASRRRVVPAHVVREQHEHLQASIKRLGEEGVQAIHVFASPAEAEAASVSH